MLLEFSMFPTDKGESLGDYIARSLDIVDKSELPYQLTSMGTIIEGEWDEIFPVVKRCFDKMQKDCNRISCSIKIDWRRGKTGQIKYKVEAIERRMGKRLGRQ